MSFWDNLNKIIKPKKEAVLQARVGEGMTPEQTTVAKAVIAKPTTTKPKVSFWDVINGIPKAAVDVYKPAFKPTIDIVKNTVKNTIEAVKDPKVLATRFAESTPDINKILTAKTPEEKKVAFNEFSMPIIGFSGGLRFTPGTIEKIVASTSAPEISALIRKEAPRVGQKTADNLGEILKFVDDRNTVEATINRINYNLSKSPAPVANETKLALQDKVAYLDDILREHPGKTLINRVSRTTGLLPEVTGQRTMQSLTGSGRIVKASDFARRGDNITQELSQDYYGVPDKSGQEIVDEYKALVEQRNALKDQARNMPKENIPVNNDTGLESKFRQVGLEGEIPQTIQKDLEVIANKSVLGLDRYTKLSNFLEKKGFVLDDTAELGIRKIETKPIDIIKEHLKKDQYGNNLAYNAREQAIVNQSKSVPFMPKPVQQPSLRVSQLDTTTGEGRSLEKIANQEGAVPTLAKTQVNVGDSSLVKSIQKEPTPVKQKVSWVDYLRTPDRVLEKIGMKKEADALRASHDKYLQELPKNIETITKWSKRASSTGNKDIFRWLDGQPIDLKPQDKVVALEIKAWLKQWADRLGLKSEERITHYITHIFDKELIGKEFPEELAKMIRNKIPGEVYDPFLQERLGSLGYREDTWAALDAYVKRATRKVNMDPALEKVKEAASMLEETQYDFVKSYINTINMRPNKIDTLVDNSIKQLIGYRLGQRPLLSVTKFMRQMTYRAMLGLNPASALKNISQGINTYAKLGEKYTTIGYIKLFKKGAKEELLREGVLNGGFIEDRALSATSKAIENFDKGLFYFFQTAEHINRGAAYFGAKAQGLKKGMTEEEAIEYGKKIVRDTQFVFGKIDTPLVLSSDLGKTLGQFQSFTVKQIEFLTEMGKKAVKGDQKAKNFIGLLRYAMAGTIFVYTIGQAFNMKIGDLIPGVRFGTPPSLKLPVEATKAVLDAPNKYGQKRDFQQKLKDVGNTLWGVVPGGTQLKKTYQGYKAIKEGASVDAAGRTQFDVGGTPLKDAQALIFGKYSGQGAKDYYENDLTYAEATLANIKKLPPEEAKAKLLGIVKDNPALFRSIIQVTKKQALGVTEKDQQLLNLGVANKARAKEVAKQLNKLKTREEKAELLRDYVTKKILTNEVLKQLPEFLTK